MKLPEDVAVNVARSLEEARKKKKGGMFPFMLKMGGKLVALVPAVIAGLGLLATKALIVAKIALVLSAIVFFSSGFGGKVNTNFSQPINHLNTTITNFLQYFRALQFWDPSEVSEVDMVDSQVITTIMVLVTAATVHQHGLLTRLVTQVPTRTLAPSMLLRTLLLRQTPHTIWLTPNSSRERHVAQSSRNIACLNVTCVRI